MLKPFGRRIGYSHCLKVTPQISYIEQQVPLQWRSNLPSTLMGQTNMCLPYDRHSIIYVILLTKNVYTASNHDKTIRQIQFETT